MLEHSQYSTPSDRNHKPVDLHLQNISKITFQQVSKIEAIMSASKALFGADPAATMVIRKVTENITTFSMPFARFNQAKIGGRGTVGKHILSRAYITSLCLLRVTRL